MTERADHRDRTGGTSSTDDDDVRDVGARLASIVIDAGPPETALREVAALAKRVLPDVEDVSLTVVEDGRPRTLVFTGSLAVALDERQYETGFGPCLDAARSGQSITVDRDDQDDADSPYRAFAGVAARAGIAQTLSVGLPVAGRSIGGLNVYRTVADHPADALLDELIAFAGSAASVVNNVASYAKAAAEATHLRTAMDSRAVIEQAKGILMARERCSADEAFALLSRISQHKHLKLRDVAAAIVAEVARYPAPRQ